MSQQTAPRLHPCAPGAGDGRGGGPPRQTGQLLSRNGLWDNSTLGIGCGITKWGWFWFSAGRRALPLCRAQPASCITGWITGLAGPGCRSLDHALPLLLILQHPLA